MVLLATSKGFERLKVRLKRLESRVMSSQKEVGEAASQGAETWHDNAPYHAALSDLRVHDKILNEAHASLPDLTIVEYPLALPDRKAVYGTKVVFEQDGRKDTLRIVGLGDDDLDKDRVLYNSPIAQILLGHMEGESYAAMLRSKRVQIKIKEVHLLTVSDLE